MTLTLRPGPVSARWVYRRMRRVLLANARCDLMIRVIRFPDVPDFDRYPATVGAVDALDLVCKVLDYAPILRLRTRYWHGRALPMVKQAHHHGLRRGEWHRAGGGQASGSRVRPLGVGVAAARRTGRNRRVGTGSERTVGPPFEVGPFALGVSVDVRGRGW